MKRLKITALLLILSLLLGLLPMAMAAQPGSMDTYCSKTMNGQHSWGDWTITKQATCTETGSRTRTCGRCRYQQTESIPKTGHMWGSWKTTKEATCSKKGEQTRKCSVCGKTETRETDRKPHTWGEWTVTVEPTDFSMGAHSHVCKVCGKEKTEDFYPDPTYKKGDKGDGVKDLQEKLNAAGYNCGKVDGDFGKKTEAAVKAIEEDHGVEPDGIAWPGVQKWLAGGGEPDTEGGVGEYGWEPPEVEDAPEEPEEPNAPAGEVSPASIEPSELYDVTVQVQDTSGMKYVMDPVEVLVTFTNTGSKTVDVSCKGRYYGSYKYPKYTLVACTFGELTDIDFHMQWSARLEPEQSSTVTVKVSLCKEDLEKEEIEGKVPAWFCPTEASESSGYYPVDWPWEDKPRELDVAFKIGLGDPAIKQFIFGGAPVNVGEKHWIGMQGHNYGPYTLYKMESDLYEWNKDTQEYVFRETVLISDAYKHPMTVSPSNYWFSGDVTEFEVTKELVAESEDGVLKFGLQSRSWTKDGTLVESEFQTKEFLVFDGTVFLEAEDTSGGQIPEDGWVKVKLTASNLGTEIMAYYDDLCYSDDFRTMAEELHDYDLSWLKPGASEDMELWIRVQDEDVQAGEVRRKVYLKFIRQHDEDGKRLPADAAKEDAAEEKWYDRHTDTNEVEIVIPLLKASEASGVTPPPAPKPPAYCAPALIGLGEGTAEWTLTRCPEHWAVAKAANKLLAEAEDDAAKLAAYESAIQQWSDTLNAGYEAMLAKAGDAEKALIEAEKAAFEAQLAAHQAALALEHDPAQVAGRIADLLMKKTAEICYERHTAPETRADLYAAATGSLPSAGGGWRCEIRTDEARETLRVTEALCEDHQAVEALAAEARDAEGWRDVKLMWLVELDRITNTRYIDMDEAGRSVIAAERINFGQWLAARETLLNRLYPNDGAVVQELLAQAIRARVLENCAD